MNCQFCEAEADYRLDLDKQYPKGGGVVGRCVRHLAPWNRPHATPVHEEPPVVTDAALSEAERPAPPEVKPKARKPRIKKEAPADAAGFDPA